MLSQRAPTGLIVSNRWCEGVKRNLPNMVSEPCTDNVCLGCSGRTRYRAGLWADHFLSAVAKVHAVRPG
jgi:hypothetical protein